MWVRARVPGIAATGLLLMAPAPARAAEGMPQLDFANPLTIAQIVWLAIIFLTLYLLLANWALPQVAGVLQLRAGTIAADLDAARAAKGEADAAVAELTRATREAQAGAQAEIARAVAEAKAVADKDAAALNAKLDVQLAGAEQRIAEARTSALGALEQVAGDTARVVVGRLTGTAVAPATVDRAVAAVLAARAA